MPKTTKHEFGQYMSTKTVARWVLDDAAEAIERGLAVLDRRGVRDGPVWRILRDALNKLDKADDAIFALED